MIGKHRTVTSGWQCNY